MRVIPRSFLKKLRSFTRKNNRFVFNTELKNAPDIVFSFTEEQHDKFNAVFEELQYETVLRCNVDIVSSVRRLGLVTFSKQKFWSDLPPQFDTQTFLQTAASNAIAPKTAEKHITAWCKGGQLVRIAQGKYEKV